VRNNRIVDCEIDYPLQSQRFGLGFETNEELARFVHIILLRANAGDFIKGEKNVGIQERVFTRSL
jgi:hypothetical protein